ncbi:MAG: hypothetical protein RR582_09700, partial [Niameybacter sp.]
MKLRQKLAIVLASAMIITAVPVVTSAASTNGFNKTLSIVADKAITTGQNLFLEVKYATNDAKVNAGDTFFVNATDFEFNEKAYKDGVFGKDTNATITWLSKSQLKVELKGNQGVVNIPVAGTPKKGNPAITVDGEDSLATSGKYSLTGSEVVTDKTLVATAGTVKNISVDGEGAIADIVIEEQVANTLTTGSKITVKLANSSDLNFKAGQAIKVEGTRGLAGKTMTATVVAANSDEKTLEIELGGITGANSRGAIKLQGIQVEAENKKVDVKTGEVKVTVKAKGMDDAKLVVANVTDFGVKLNVKEEVEVVAGK